MAKMCAYLPDTAYSARIYSTVFRFLRRMVEIKKHKRKDESCATKFFANNFNTKKKPFQAVLKGQTDLISLNIQIETARYLFNFLFNWIGLTIR